MTSFILMGCLLLPNRFNFNFFISFLFLFFEFSFWPAGEVTKTNWFLQITILIFKIILPIIFQIILEVIGQFDPRNLIIKFPIFRCF